VEHFFTHLLDCLTLLVCPRVSARQLAGYSMCRCIFAAIAAVVLTILVTWCTQRDAGVSGQYMPQGCTVHMYISFLYLSCNKAFFNCYIYMFTFVCTADSQLLAPCCCFLNLLFQCCFCTIYIGVCVSQLWISLPLALLIIFSHRLDELNSWGNQSHI
jgi:hypothetical protein